MNVVSQNERDNIAVAFFATLRIASLAPPAQLLLTGGLGVGVAWELRSDLCNYGREFLSFFESQLSEVEIRAVRSYLRDTETLLESTVTGEGPEVGLLHAAWDAQRVRSEELIRILRLKIAETYTRLEMDVDWLETTSTSQLGYG
jgi:hypothetical protein